MTGRLLVTPEKLTSGANAFDSSASQLQSTTNQMLQMVESMNRVWQGEASTMYRNKFKQLEDDMRRMFKMAQEHARDLRDMAKNYQDAEALNKSTFGGLNTNPVQ